MNVKSEGLEKLYRITFCGFVSGCEALALCGRAACTKPLLAAVFLFDYQRVKK